MVETLVYPLSEDKQACVSADVADAQRGRSRSEGRALGAFVELPEGQKRTRGVSREKCDSKRTRGSTEAPGGSKNRQKSGEFNEHNLEP